MLANKTALCIYTQCEESTTHKKHFLYASLAQINTYAHKRANNIGFYRVRTKTNIPSASLHVHGIVIKTKLSNVELQEQS